VLLEKEFCFVPINATSIKKVRTPGCCSTPPPPRASIANAQPTAFLPPPIPQVVQIPIAQIQDLKLDRSNHHKFADTTQTMRSAKVASAYTRRPCARPRVLSGGPVAGLVELRRGRPAGRRRGQGWWRAFGPHPALRV
jgi:hypothetical protein